MVLFSKTIRCFQRTHTLYKWLPTMMNLNCVTPPLGSHFKQHKLGIVFYTLANIHLKHRSQLKNINLAIAATVPVIEKHSLDSVLEPFISNLNSVFLLADFNSQLLNFNFGYSEGDKPIPILSNALHDPKKSLRSSSAQMLLLIRILPFLIGEKIDEGEDHWYCYLLLAYCSSWNVVFVGLCCNCFGLILLYRKLLFLTSILRLVYQNNTA